MASCLVIVNALSQVKDIGCTRSGLVQVPNNQGILSLSRVGGFFLGLILSMVPICLAQVSLVVEFGERYGLLNFFLSLGNLFGVPIAAVIIGNGSVHNYNMFSILVCVCSVIGTLFWYLSRHSIVGFRLNVKI